MQFLYFLEAHRTPAIDAVMGIITHIGDELFFIVGSDMLLSFNRWYKSEEILEMITLCAADRENDGVELEMPDFLKNKRVIITKLSPFELSSTQIRERISNGESTEGMLDEAVRFYIDEKGLYR